MSGPHVEAERPIEGWKNIAAEVGLTVPTAWRVARRNRDPLPVWAYLHTVIAWASAIREWKSRQILPLPVAEKMKEIGVKSETQTTETPENDPPTTPKNKRRS